MSVSADGRFLSYSSDDTGNLMVRDLQTHADRALTNNGGVEGSGDWVYKSAISRDGKTIAYAVTTGPAGNRHRQIRLLPFSATPADTPTVIVDGGTERTPSPYEWSKDGRWLAVQVLDAKGAHIGVVDVSSGDLRLIRTLGRRGTSRLAMSPDGNFLAFDDLIDPTAARRLSVISARRTGDELVLAGSSRDRIVGWSADSRTLLFLSNRRGVVDLWAQLVSDSRLSGAPFMLRGDVDGIPIGTTESDALVYYASTVRQTIQIATVDPTSGRVLSAPKSIATDLRGFSTAPRWSADGSSFAYLWYSSSTATERSMVIETSGGRRLLPLTVEPRDSLDWSRDGSEFTARALSPDGRQGIYRIDASTGAATLVENDTTGVSRFYPEYSIDRTKLYYLRIVRVAGSSTVSEAYVERDLATGQERELFRPAQTGLRFSGRSPDGRFVVAFTVLPESALMLVNATDGATRELLRVPQGGVFSRHGGLRWTPDSQAVLVIQTVKGKSDLWRIPLAGPPLRLSIDFPDLVESMIDVHPDGRQIAFLAGQSPLTEIRLLERFLGPGRAR